MSAFDLALAVLLAPAALALLFPALLALTFRERPALAWRALRAVSIPAAGLVLLPALVFPLAPLRLFYAALGVVAALSMLMGLVVVIARAVKDFREEVTQEYAGRVGHRSHATDAVGARRGVGDRTANQ